MTAASAVAQCHDTCNVLHSFIGEAANDNFGWVSSPIPDIDNDGADEVVIAAPYNDAGGANAGRVYLYSGRTGEELWRFTSTVPNENAGISVRDAGDVNDDRIPDVIVGAPTSGPGRAYVLSGRDGATIWTIDGSESGERFGSAVSGIGDLNNDDIPDLLVGADSHASVFGDAAGRIFIISGADGSTVIDTIDAETAGDRFGNSIANLGDIDHDQVDDFVVGAFKGNPNRNGRAYVYSGKTRTLLFSVDPTGSTAVNFAQFFVATPGDVNNDGTNDVYVSDFGDRTNGAGAGKAYVFSGVDGSVLHEWLGQSGEGFGIGRGCGDVNFDGYDDLFLCSWTYSQVASSAGRGQVFSGKDGSVIRTFTSSVAGETFGFDAHGIGDVDNDGRLDFFATAAWNSESGPRAGKCYLISGGLTLQPLTPGAAGRPNDTAVNGARPGDRVVLVGGLRTGSTKIPGCSGMTVSIRKPTIVGSKIADANGNVSFSIDVPKFLRGKTTYLQAVELGDCQVSNPLEVMFP